MSESKAEQNSATTGLAKATLAVPSSKAAASKAEASQPQAANAQPRQGIGTLRMVGVVALAAIAGALGGALSTAGLNQLDFVSNEGTTAQSPALEASVARIEADIPALKANFEYSSEIGLAKLNETSARLDRLEKAQAEPAAKLAQLSAAVEKLRTAAVAPAPVAAATDTTGSIEPSAASAAAPAAETAPAAEVARLPTVQGWRLRGIARGTALIQGRRGLFEVHTGTTIPGVGRVDAIRRQDGRWAVVTAKGLIVGR